MNKRSYRQLLDSSCLAKAKLLLTASKHRRQEAGSVKELDEILDDLDKTQ